MNPVQSSGLSSQEAARRLGEQGANELARAEGSSHWVLLLGQFKSPVVWLLLGAGVASGLLAEVADAVAIFAIVIINAIVGFAQEARAERAVLALRSMTAPRASVLRDGHPVVIAAREVVEGDVLLLEAGDIVAADARVVEAHRLCTNEAPLTGESGAVDKSTQAVAPDAPLAERFDSVFMGTAVANGTGRAVVIATGMKTEIGKIANLLAAARESETPLQKRLAVVSRLLVYVCVAIVALVALVGLLRGVAPLDVFLSAVSLAVAAVPEGLPATVTIALAIGVQRMAARNVLVRRLHAVETLGCATTICTDKTGTLTTGVMTVREIIAKDEQRLLDVAAACCDAELGPDQTNGVGDPTEVALLSAAAKRAIVRDVIERERPRVTVLPFDSQRKRMSIQRSDGVLYVKGAVESVLSVCTSGTEGIEASNAELAGKGLRVLAVAVGRGDVEAELECLGLVGIADPPRAEAVDAVRRARSAGITTVMITGDHRATAHAIAREMGILGDADEPEQRVHARATPEDKLRIVRNWKQRGAIVAMTGDGVNDAPALREADIGIAMGKTGTEVTREASDIVLADDNFASIVAAIREGRGIFDNIRKTVMYLLAGNAGELLVMLVAALLGLPLPLLPLHLLWINLVTDGLPALALVIEPPAEDVLERPARAPTEPLLGRKEWTAIVLTGVLQAGVTLGVFVWALQTRDVDTARNLAFSTLVFGELLRAFAARSPTRLFLELGAFSNRPLLVVLGVSLALQLLIHQLPFTQSLFRVTALSLFDWALTLALGLVPVSLLEIAKLVRRSGHMPASTELATG
jgi:P-type Ca2+ transporter type 2C